MKLITLNIWGGKLYNSLLSFVTDYSEKIDVFCFQEVYRAPRDKLISRDMHADIFGEIAQNLKDHRGFFAPHLKGYDLGGKVDFELEAGLALYIRKDIRVQECKDFFIYRDGLELLHDDIQTIPRNIQYISFTIDNKTYLVAHFHGIWYPKTKVDTDDRVKQAQKIKVFLSKRKEKKILCGDFNLLPSTKSMDILEKGMTNLIKEYDIKTTRTKHYEREEKHADYVLVSSDFTVQNFGAIDTVVSDHLPLLLEFS